MNVRCYADGSGPRVAVACSGLGHVQRGIEAWAADLCQALRRTGSDVTLFGAESSPDGMVGIACLRRRDRAARAIAGAVRHLGGWRYGMGSPYDVEQTSFAVSLWQRIHHGFDILHIQDPMIATWFERAHRRGLSRARVIYANGTGENEQVMRRFTHLQLLTPAAFDSWQPRKPAGQTVFMLPNFIDTGRFTPGDRLSARAQFDLPPDATIVLCCAAIRRYHKRIDYLLSEFADAIGSGTTGALLVIAGATEVDTDGLIAEGKRLLGDRVRFLPDLPRDRMPDLYRAADIFTLPSLHEMFGIVLLEAMATGLPVLCHDEPGFRAIVGPAGIYRDFSQAGGLASALTAAFGHETRTGLSLAARRHVEQHFSDDAVIPKIKAMYNTVLGGPHDG
ncbi:MAG TPA: glycosyltransferase family 4 protein [Acetobacteraceae bacterium]